MNISLWGYMGSGKSTIGPLLAEEVRKQWLDLDAEIEREEGTTIREIFEQYGEYYFRKLERKYLISVLKRNDLVIGLGGGTPCFYDNAERINTRSKSVWLAPPVDAIIERLEDKRGERPILMEWGGAWQERLKEHYASRIKYYEKAEYKTHKSDVQALLSEIERATERL